MLFSVMMVEKSPKFEHQYKGSHFKFWNFEFRLEFSRAKYLYICIKFKAYPILKNAIFLNSKG